MTSTPEEAVDDFLKKTIRALLYLHNLSRDIGSEPLGCIFNILIIAIIEGPKEVEILHDLVHEYHDDLETRDCFDRNHITKAVKQFVEE